MTTVSARLDLPAYTPWASGEGRCDGPFRVEQRRHAPAMTGETTKAGGSERPTRNRVSIAERAARRDRAEHTGRDRHESLLRQLRAGREMPVTRPRGSRLQWHPVARWLIAAAVLGVASYFVMTVASALIRENRVDTWAGPSQAVTSGQKLDTCVQVPRRNDALFPTWIRYEGGLFIEADGVLPMGDTNIGDYYLDSGYSNDGLRIYDVAVEGLGAPGTRILVRAGDAPGGELYRRLEGCS